MVAEIEVIMAYRLLLGREPENQQVVTGQAGHYQNLRDLRAGFMASPEFLASFNTSTVGATDFGVKPLIWPRINVEVDVATEILQRMVKRVEHEFIELGSQEPHWFVLTEDRFKSENIARTEDDFYKTGELAVNDLRAAAARSGLDLSHYQSCFELGCGLGRSTVWLACQFKHVAGGDISGVHLTHARNAVARFGITNTTFILLNEISRYLTLPAFDVFFSIIVLQHNPPPLMAFILETVLQHLLPGGIAYFQIPTYIVNYDFLADRYLDTETPPGDVEVHCMPQTALFEIIRRTGCSVLEMREDGAIGANAISNRLLLRKH